MIESRTFLRGLRRIGDVYKMRILQDRRLAVYHPNPEDLTLEEAIAAQELPRLRSAVYQHILASRSP